MNELLSVIQEPGSQKLFFMVFLGSMAYALKPESVSLAVASREFFRRFVGGLFGGVIGSMALSLDLGTWFWAGIGTGYFGNQIWKLLEGVFDLLVQKLPTIIADAIEGYLKQYLKKREDKDDDNVST